MNNYITLKKQLPIRKERELFNLECLFEIKYVVWYNKHCLAKPVFLHREVGAMSVYEALSLMIGFGILVATIIHKR